MGAGWLLLALAIVAGCAQAPKPLPPVPAAAVGLPRKVALLPFENRTANPDAAVVLRRMFFNFFSSLNYADIEPAAVDATLAAGRAGEAATGDGSWPPEKLGQLLGVDAVVVGEALALGQTYALVYANQQAGLRARMLRCSTGEVIWEMEHTVTLHEGDLPLSLPGLAAALVKTAFNFQQSNTLRAASELCMQMVATIPDPPTEAEIPPRIQTLVHNGAAGLLAPGDELRVVMVGEKKQKASFSLPPLLPEAPMEEREPGVYTAAYRIQPQDRLAEGQLTGYLRSPSGSSRQWVDALGPIRIGRPTVLPAAIAEDTVLTADRSPYLVEEALVVMPGVTLTLDPGVVVWFRTLGLVVKGTLQARGTAEHPVAFSGLKTKGWKGIFIEGGEGINLLRHSRISGAEFGIRFTRARISLEACRFQENTWAVVGEEGRIDIRGSLVRASAKAGISARNTRLAVSGSVVAENAGGGFLLEDSPAVIEGNDIVNNGGWAIKATGPPAEVLAGRNWWGQVQPELSETVRGPVQTQPPLPASISAGSPVRTRE